MMPRGPPRHAQQTWPRDMADTPRNTPTAGFASDDGRLHPDTAQNPVITTDTRFITGRDGYGYGDGDGYGNGYAYGDGDGDGHGYGHGDGIAEGDEGFMQAIYRIAVYEGTYYAPAK